MTFRGGVALFALVGLFLLSGAVVAPPAHSAGVHVARPSGAAAASGPAPISCPTPPSTGNWNSGNFFSDLDVNISVPEDPALSGSSFQTVPCSNIVPTYTQGIWVNLSTDVAISSATLSVWALGWPTANNPAPPVAGFLPTSVARLPMYVSPPPSTQASFFINCYRYFWPGSEVFFNITVNSTVGVPNSVHSSSSIYEAENYSGIVDDATWKFVVAPEWPSTTFSDDLAVSSTPSALGHAPVFDPNPVQALELTLTSLAPLQGGAAGGIGAADVYYNLTGALAGGPFSEPFATVNRSVANLTTPLGPYPNSSIQFQIKAWTQWEGGDIDPILSPVYLVNWSENGGWWYPDLGVTGNLEVSANPDVLAGAASVLPTSTPVNLTIHSPLPNVTVGSAAVVFRYTDSVGFLHGILPMQALNANTSYVTMPGLPPGGQLTFAFLTKDIFGTTISSGNYTYSEGGPIASSLQPGYGLVYIEAVDISTGELVPSLGFSIQNGSWSEHAVGTPLGFTSIISPGGGKAPFPLAYGAYTVAIAAFGETPVGTVVVSAVGPTLLVFDVASSGLPLDVWSAEPSLEIAAVAGLIAAAVTAPPILRWFRERRAKAEAEQRRVTLG